MDTYANHSTKGVLDTKDMKPELDVQCKLRVVLQHGNLQRWNIMGEDVHVKPMKWWDVGALVEVISRHPTMRSKKSGDM